MPNILDYITYIRGYSQSQGVNPDTMTGLVLWEGGNRNPNSWWSPYSHWDVIAPSNGPFQLNDKGLGSEFAQQFGWNRLKQGTWDNAVLQGKWSIDKIASKGTNWARSQWFSFRDSEKYGTPLTQLGRNWWKKYGDGKSSNKLLDQFKGDKASKNLPKELTQKKVPTEKIAPKNTPKNNIPGSQADIISGLWEPTGSTAVTTAGKVTAEATKELAKKTKEGLEEHGKAVKEAEQHAAKTAQEIRTATGTASYNLFDRFFDNTRNLFVRSSLMVIGALFLFGAVAYYAYNRAPVKTVSNVKNLRRAIPGG